LTIFNWEQRGTGTNARTTDSETLAPNAVPELNDLAAYESGFDVRNRAGRSDINTFYQRALLSGDHDAAAVSAWPDANIWIGTTLQEKTVGEKTHRGKQERELLRYDVPVVMLMGRYDLMTLYATTKEFFNVVEVPAEIFLSALASRTWETPERTLT